MWILMGCVLSCDYAPGRQFASEEEEGEQKCSKRTFCFSPLSIKSLIKSSKFSIFDTEQILKPTLPNQNVLILGL